MQETLASAFEAWSYSGVPQHYSALLTTAAKNRAIDVFRRERTARKFAPELARLVESEWTLRPAVDDMFQPAALKDDELRMMFSCCHPRLPEEAQVALILNILCGFGVDEIAAAFLASVAAIHKRLQRGKKLLAESRRLFDLGADDFARAPLRRPARALPPVQRGLSRRVPGGGRPRGPVPTGDASGDDARRARAFGDPLDEGAGVAHVPARGALGRRAPTTPAT